MFNCQALVSAITLGVLYLKGANSQLSGSVGPTTSLSDKQNTICNVLDYGGETGSSDIGSAIGDAFNNCVLNNTGSTLYVPEGDYDMQTWQTLAGGKQWAFRLDGLVTRASATHGNMIAIEDAEDFEMYSSNSAGGIQGLGYECRNDGPRFLRIINSKDFSVHDLILVDSPEFHLVVDGGSNGEVYNMAIRGADIGGSDGIDISGDNHWVHDVEVTNRDECVTVKSPASNFLIEQIWCNQSGGCAIGSLADDTDISSIVYRYVYTNGGNQAFMIKSNLGSGTVTSVLFQNFIVVDTAYGLDVNQYWSSQSPGSGDGVQLSNIKFEDWNGYVADGVERSPIQFICADGAPCTNMTLSDITLWSATDEAIVKCESAYGTGYCLESGSDATSYSVVTSTISQPSGYSTPTTMSGNLTTGFGSTASILTPTIPGTYYPGRAQISPLAKNA